MEPLQDGWEVCIYGSCTMRGKERYLALHGHGREPGAVVRTLTNRQVYLCREYLCTTNPIPCP